MKDCKITLFISNQINWKNWNKKVGKLDKFEKTRGFLRINKEESVKESFQCLE